MISNAEWQYVSFSEERMVSHLIRNRCKMESLKADDDVLCL